MRGGIHSGVARKPDQSNPRPPARAGRAPSQGISINCARRRRSRPRLFGLDRKRAAAAFPCGASFGEDDVNIRKLLDWRKLLIYSHRWLGIGIILMFLVWTLSGVVLMYYG